VARTGTAVASGRYEAVSKVDVIPRVRNTGEPRVSTLFIPWIPACAGKTHSEARTYGTASLPTGQIVRFHLLPQGIAVDAEDVGSLLKLPVVGFQDAQDDIARPMVA